jgi:hypothetical protein
LSANKFSRMVNMVLHISFAVSDLYRLCLFMFKLNSQFSCSNLAMCILTYFTLTLLFRVTCCYSIAFYRMI